MAENLGDAILELRTDSKKFDRGLKKAKKGSDKLDKSLEKTGLSAVALKTKLIAVGAGLVAAGLAINKAFDFIAQGAKLTAQRKAFENLAKTFNTSGREIIDSLRKISNQAVSTADLVAASAKAMVLNIDPSQFAKLMEIARAASKATGDTITKSFSDITIGIARQSRLILDNLGIIIKQDAVYKKFAKSIGKVASQLTDAEKRQAFLNATLSAGQRIIDGVGSEAEDASEKFAKMKASITNAFDELKIAMKDLAETNATLIQQGAEASLKAITDFLIGTKKTAIFFKAALDFFVLNDLKEIAKTAQGLLDSLDARQTGATGRRGERKVESLGGEPLIKEQIEGLGQAKFGVIADLKDIQDEFDDLYNDVGRGATEGFNKVATESESMAERMKTAVMGWGNNFSNELFDILAGSDTTFKSVLKSFVDMIGKMVLQLMVIQPLMKAVFGGIGALGGGGKSPLLTAPGLGGGGGGGLFGKIKGFIPGLADGGVVKASLGGTLIRAGEGREDEIVAPLSKMDSLGGKIVQNINISPGLPETVRAEITSFMPAIKQAAVDAVLADRRRGGNMAVAMGSRA